jgi:hypothetical protein
MVRLDLLILSLAASPDIDFFLDFRAWSGLVMNIIASIKEN